MIQDILIQSSLLVGGTGYLAAGYAKNSIVDRVVGAAFLILYVVASNLS